MMVQTRGAEAVECNGEDGGMYSLASPVYLQLCRRSSHEGRSTEEAGIENEDFHVITMM